MKGLKKTFALAIIIALPVFAFAQGDEYKLDEVYAMDEDGTIELYTDDADVVITGSDRKDVRVKIYYRVDVSGFGFSEKDFEMEIDESGGDLIIRERSFGSTGVFFGSISEQYEVTIYAPSTVSLVLKGDDDDYRIRKMNGSITIDSDDSDIEVRECNGNHFKFTIDDGDLEMEGGNGFLYVKSDDGDLFFRDGNFSEVDVTLDDADMLLETSLSQNGQYNFRVDDGTLDMRILDGGGEFEITYDDARINATDEFEILEDERHTKTLRLSNGDARIRMRSDDGRIRLSRR